MSFSEEFPFGVRKVTVYLQDTTTRVRIDPNDAGSVCAGFMMMVGRAVEQVILTPNENPGYERWIQAVANRETRMSFEDWSQE